MWAPKTTRCLSVTFKFRPKSQLKADYGPTKDIPIVALGGKLPKHYVNVYHIYLSCMCRIGENIKRLSSFVKTVTFELIIL